MLNTEEGRGQTLFRNKQYTTDIGACYRYKELDSFKCELQNVTSINPHPSIELQTSVSGRTPACKAQHVYFSSILLLSKRVFSSTPRHDLILILQRQTEPQECTGMKSFHLNSHILGFHPQTQEFEPLSGYLTL